MGYEAEENIIRQMLVDMFHFHTEGLEILIFKDCLETLVEAVPAWAITSDQR